mgnify:CR=1 FL=1
MIVHLKINFMFILSDQLVYQHKDFNRMTPDKLEGA